MTVKEFFDEEINKADNIKALSARTGKVLFTIRDGESFKKYQNCKVSSFWTDIEKFVGIGFGNCAQSVLCCLVNVDEVEDN